MINYNRNIRILIKIYKKYENKLLYKTLLIERRTANRSLLACLCNCRPIAVNANKSKTKYALLNSRKTRSSFCATFSFVSSDHSGFPNLTGTRTGFP